MYVLNIHDLKPGDIILVRDDSELSVQVQEATSSEYSHAMLYVGTSSVIDSSSNGVHSSNIGRHFFQAENDVKVLRPDDQCSQSEISQAIEYARSKIGTDYSFREAHHVTRLTSEDARLPNRQICTRLVAQAYQYAGVDLVDNADYCSPADIDRSGRLTEVQKVAIVAPDGIEQRAMQSDLLERQANITNSILQQARTIAKEDIQTFDQLAEWLVTHPEHDAVITSIVENSGYLSLWEENRNSTPWLYDVNAFVSHYDAQDRVFIAELLTRTEPEMRTRFVTTLTTCTALHQHYSLRFFEILICLNTTLINLSYQRELMAREVLARL